MRIRSVAGPLRLVSLVGVLASILAGGFEGEASAQNGRAAVKRSTSNVYATWDFSTVLGQSAVVRNAAGISASLQTSRLPPGQAVTMWFIVFNNPSACASSPCSAVDLLSNPAAEGDFLWAAGHLTGQSGKSGFAGHLAVGDASGSAFMELGLPEQAIGLTDPLNAEVHLALHSHGPALSGQALKEQMTSFLGGCQVFLGGADGIADAPGDVPDAVGECSTFQVSVHQ
jgi:hypothetical protein